MRALDLDTILAGSFFLKNLAGKFPQLLKGDPQQHIQTILNELETGLANPITEAEIKTLLRNTRNKAALVVALADAQKRWTLRSVTRHLTIIADACLQAGVRWLLTDAASKGQFSPVDLEDPAKGCGYTVLAMGKQGGFELNFSSDIDLIIFYDRYKAPLADGVEPAQFFVRLTRKLVCLLQDVTGDGYAYRVDLRLRPDPRATQVALAVDAALNYYESIGQNWERAAMIKARPVAGDLALGEAFLQELRPFIWRKYLDFAAIMEVHNLKKQINAVKGHGEVSVLGHNLKLGRGGIREIEFFVQTQQLIAGGRNENLRGKSTLKMLDALVDAGWVERQTADEMARAYDFLRTIEHRLQMVADQQTHSLPADPAQLETFSHFAGFQSSDALAADVKKYLERVQSHYDALFENGENNGGTDLVFSGADDDLATLERLRGMGFSQPRNTSALIKGWYAGRYRALLTDVARERLDELLPEILQALAASRDPDATFAAFDRFLAGLPAGIQLFSLLRANRHFIALIANILGTAPKLATELSHRPRIFEAFLEPDFFTEAPQNIDFAAQLREAIPDDIPFDDVLDRARVFGREKSFRIGVRILSDTLSGADAGLAYSRLASSLIDRLLAVCENEVALRHGNVPGGKIAIVAMGKLGGREMTAGSDVDLITIFDHDETAIMSDGEKPLSPNQYYARVTQRLITALTAPTAEGVLYDVDMRLRPSGNKGPIATRLSAFVDYQANSAWTWEKMALTRARVIAGYADFTEAVGAAINQSLCQAREPQAIINDAAEMRQTIFAAKPSKGVWDLKNAPGGMVDIEFIVQTLLIIHAHDHPEILDQRIIQSLENLAAAGLLAHATANELVTHYRLYQRLDQVLKLGVSGTFDADKAPAGLKQLVKSIMAAPDMGVAESQLAEAQQAARQVFEEIMKPASE